jgi:hypothetical protein
VIQNDVACFQGRSKPLGAHLREVREEEGGRRKEEGGRRKEEAGSRKQKAGSRKQEGGRRKEEGGRRKEEKEVSLQNYQDPRPKILSEDLSRKNFRYRGAQKLRNPLPRFVTEPTKKVKIYK